ncbi:MAG TPA: HAD family phosphatase [Myxococcota bacterium]|nr:HAD family phosphatase [Myxococcota bacterium]
MAFRAVIFDLGGVVLGSPLHAIAAYERELGIPEGFVNRVVVDSGPEGAWSRLERGELSMEAFHPAFEADCDARGHRLSAAEMMGRIHAAAAPRPAMLEAVRRIRGRALITAALTNNWAAEDEAGGPGSALRPHFDFFVESSKLGLRKPDRRIYRYTCELMDVAPEESVFLDDIGRNLKTARELGMTTLKVHDPDASLSELAGLLGFALDEGAS